MKISIKKSWRISVILYLTSLQKRKINTSKTKAVFSLFEFCEIDSHVYLDESYIVMPEVSRQT